MLTEYLDVGSTYLDDSNKLFILKNKSIPGFQNAGAGLFEDFFCVQFTTCPVRVPSSTLVGFPGAQVRLRPPPEPLAIAFKDRSRKVGLVFESKIHLNTPVVLVVLSPCLSREPSHASPVRPPSGLIEQVPCGYVGLAEHVPSGLASVPIHPGGRGPHGTSWNLTSTTPTLVCRSTSSSSLVAQPGSIWVSEAGCDAHIVSFSFFVDGSVTSTARPRHRCIELDRSGPQRIGKDPWAQLVAARPGWAGVKVKDSGGI